VATHVAFVAHVCHIVRLLPFQVILIRISTTSSDMGEACSLCLNVEVLYHHVHMRFMVRFNFDTKNGLLSYHA
jgi:hypothetical protein